MTAVSARFDRLGQEGPARLGILGGTFDPIHIGHLIYAEQVCQTLQLDGLVFMPAAQPVFKRDRHISSPKDRLAMCALAIEDNPRFDVSSLEIDRGGNTYTVETLEFLRSFFPATVTLYFIVGSDVLTQLPKWRRSADLARLATFVTATRPGFRAEEGIIATLDAMGFCLRQVPVSAIDVSSSDIRSRVQRGLTIRYLLPHKVERYIYDHTLYIQGEDYGEA